MWNWFHQIFCSTWGQNLKRDSSNYTCVKLEGLQENVENIGETPKTLDNINNVSLFIWGQFPQTWKKFSSSSKEITKLFWSTEMICMTCKTWRDCGKWMDLSSNPSTSCLKNYRPDRFWRFELFPFLKLFEFRRNFRCPLINSFCFWGQSAMNKLC